MTFYGFSLAKSMLQEPELCIPPPPPVVFRRYPPPREATCHLTTYARLNCSRMNPSETELTDRRIGLNMNYSIIFT